jgi:hypothetical protein
MEKGFSLEIFSLSLLFFTPFCRAEQPAEPVYHVCDATLFHSPPPRSYFIMSGNHFLSTESENGFNVPISRGEALHAM